MSKKYLRGTKNDEFYRAYIEFLVGKLFYDHE